LEGCIASDFEADSWGAAARIHLDGEGRVEGRARAMWFSAEAMAERVQFAYDHLIASPGESPGDLP
jgi:hypothetical protein